jgi:CubicO group peptidase (beta-lactamase class C family)
MPDFKILLLLALPLGLAAAPAKPAPSPLPETTPAAARVSTVGLAKMHAVMDDSVARGDHAGFVTILARDGQIVDWHTVGVRDVATRAPMQRDTILRIYSMTKIVTAVATLALVEDGKLALDDPLAKFLPEFAAPQVLVGGTADAPKLEPARTPITIRHLLSHTGGLSYDILDYPPVTDLYKRADLWDSPSLPEFVRRAAKLPLKTQPGTEWSYSIGADLLGAVIERVSGTDFESFLRRRIFAPLRMSDTSFDVPAEKLPRLAMLSQHASTKDRTLVPAEPIIGAYAEPGRGFASGGAGLFSTAGDFLRFAQMLCNGGELDGVRILHAETVAQMHINQLSHLAKKNHDFSDAHGWGLGVEVELDARTAAFGWCGAATTHVRISPRKRTVSLLFAQHIPFNEHGIFAPFVAACRAALE